MKVLIAYEWCHVGGVETFMVALQRSLHERGIECELFFFERGPMAEHLPANCRAHYGDLADLMKLIEDEGFDLVHANSNDWHLGISAARTTGVCLVVTAHGMLVPGWNSTNCDAIACVSEWLAVAHRALTDLPVHRIYNGIDTQTFAPPADATAGDRSTETSPIVAWVGRGIDMTHKRIDKLAAIAPQLVRAGVRLWIADPYGADEVEKVAPEAARTLRPLAEFWGMVPKDRLPNFFHKVAASGGCVLSTSVHEGLGLAWVEAQACGCPAIGADVCGVNEVIDPAHGGVLYPPDLQPEDLVKLVLDTLADKERMQWRRAACSAYIHERFSLTRMADEYVHLYQEALAHSQQAPRGIRIWEWLAFLTDWNGYIEKRWTAGESLYEAFQRLEERGEKELARRVARLSFATCPTLYIKPQRMKHLLRTLFGSTAPLSKHAARSVR